MGCKFEGDFNREGGIQTQRVALIEIESPPFPNFSIFPKALLGLFITPKWGRNSREWENRQVGQFSY
jgi:hypothetical protein